MGAFAKDGEGEASGITTGQIGSIGGILLSLTNAVGGIFGAKYASKVSINETQQNGETNRVNAIQSAENIRLAAEQKSKTMRTIVIAAGGVLVTGLLAFLIIRKK
jgi:hypothetical protein